MCHCIKCIRGASFSLLCSWIFICSTRSPASALDFSRCSIASALALRLARSLLLFALLFVCLALSVDGVVNTWIPPIGWECLLHETWKSHYFQVLALPLVWMDASSSSKYSHFDSIHLYLSSAKLQCHAVAATFRSLSSLFLYLSVSSRAIISSALAGSVRPAPFIKQWPKLNEWAKLSGKGPERKAIRMRRGRAADSSFIRRLIDTRS